MVLEVAFEDLAIWFHDLTLSVELALTEYALQDASVGLQYLALSVKHVVSEETFSDGPISTNDLCVTLQLVVAEVTFNALTLEDVAAKAVQTVQAIRTMLQFTFVKEALLLIIIVYDLYATDLARLPVLGTVLHFDDFFYSPYTEMIFELEDALLE